MLASSTFRLSCVNFILETVLAQRKLYYQTMDISNQEQTYVLIPLGAGKCVRVSYSGVCAGTRHTFSSPFSSVEDPDADPHLVLPNPDPYWDCGSGKLTLINKRPYKRLLYLSIRYRYLRRYLLFCDVPSSPVISSPFLHKTIFFL